MKPFYTERCRERVRVILGDSMSEDESGSRGRFETARTPTTIEVETWNRHATDDWARVRANINDATPLSVHPNTTKRWEELADRTCSFFDDFKRTALTVSVVTVGARTNDQVSFIGLAQITVYSVLHNNRVQTWF